jgi:hypothetical protein
VLRDFNPRYDCFGSISTKLGCPRHVRFPPDSDHRADIARGPVGAMMRHGLYSITSSASACKVGDTARPSFFAVLRLITSS